MASAGVTVPRGSGASYEYGDRETPLADSCQQPHTRWVIRAHFRLCIHDTRQLDSLDSLRRVVETKYLPIPGKSMPIEELVARLPLEEEFPRGKLLKNLNWAYTRARLRHARPKCVVEREPWGTKPACCCVAPANWRFEVWISDEEAAKEFHKQLEMFQDWEPAFCLGLQHAVLSKHVDDCKGAGPRVETVSESGLANYDQQATLPHAIQPMVHGQDAGSNCTSLQSQLTLVSVDVNICFRDSQDAVPLVQQLWWEVASRYNWIYNPLLLTWPSRVHPESPSQLLYFSYTVPGTDYSQEGQTCFEGATCCCSQPATWHIRASFRATSMAKEFKQRIMEGLAYDAMEKTGALCLAPRHAGGSMTHLNTTA
eukprot:jgi/Tetstr1/435229/TSEL_024148.t1